MLIFNDFNLFSILELISNGLLNLITELRNDLEVLELEFLINAEILIFLVAVDSPKSTVSQFSPILVSFFPLMGILVNWGL